MIQVQNLAKSFDYRPAVKNLSFTAPDGAITGLLGANGAGKTTTLRMICGVLQPEAGTVTIDDAASGAGTDPRVRQRRLGALLDHIGVYPRLTVRENLAYFGMLRGMPHAALAERVNQAIAALGLETIADRRTAGFSQGCWTSLPMVWMFPRCARCGICCGAGATRARACCSPATCSKKCGRCATRW